MWIPDFILKLVGKQVANKLNLQEARMDSFKIWLLETIVKRAIPRAVAGLVGLMVSKGIVVELAKFGIPVDVAKFQTEITILALAGADVALRHLKQGAGTVATKIKKAVTPPEPEQEKPQ